MRNIKKVIISGAFLVVACISLAFATALHDMIHDHFFKDDIFSQGLDALMMMISYCGVYVFVHLCLEDRQ